MPRLTIGQSNYGLRAYARGIDGKLVNVDLGSRRVDRLTVVITQQDLPRVKLRYAQVVQRISHQVMLVKSLIVLELVNSYGFSDLEPRNLRSLVVTVFCFSYHLRREALLTTSASISCTELSLLSE